MDLRRDPARLALGPLQSVTAVLADLIAVDPRIVLRVAAVSIPATDDSMVCSAMANSSAGPAFPATAMSRMPRQWWRSMVTRRRGRRSRATAPIVSRSHAIRTGAKDSRPSAIHRYEEPHVTEMTTTRIHSVGPKWPGRVPALVVRTRGGAWDIEPA